MNHVGIASSAVPPSRARHLRHHSCPKTRMPQPNSLTPKSQTKQDFARRRDQPEYSCPEGERPPLLRSLPLGEGRVNGDARLTPDFIEHYTLALVASPADAGTARVRAHSRCAAISSARVVESGTVCASASSRDCVFSALFSEYAA
jgi:hypothetical protein